MVVGLQKRFNLEVTVKKWTDIINNYVSHDFLKYLIINDQNFDELDEELKSKFKKDYGIFKTVLIDIKNSPQVNLTFEEIFSEIIYNRLHKK